MKDCICETRQRLALSMCGLLVMPGILSLAGVTGVASKPVSAITETEMVAEDSDPEAETTAPVETGTTEATEYSLSIVAKHGTIEIIEVQLAGEKSASAEHAGQTKLKLPENSTVRIEVAPERGYQFSTKGLDGVAITPEAEINVFTLKMPARDLQLKGMFEKTADTVESTSETVKGGSVKLADNEPAFVAGTARLVVTDAQPTEKQVRNFAKAATGMGDYTVQSYLDISLYNVMNKAGTDTDWTTGVSELANEATVTLTLDDAAMGDSIVVVHEHEGKYEIVPVSYNFVNNTITFKTKSFSSYAIATKSNAVVAAGGEMTSSGASGTPNTGDGVWSFVVMGVIGLAVMASGIVALRKQIH